MGNPFRMTLFAFLVAACSTPYCRSSMSPTRVTDVKEVATPTSISVTHTATAILHATRETQVENDAASLPIPHGWISYANDDYRFAFSFPEEVPIEVPEKGPLQIGVYTDTDNPFYIKATRDYLPGDVTYFLDVASSSQRTLGAYEWQIYLLPHGYGDGPDVSPPILALQIEVGDVLYSVVFLNQEMMSPLQEQILSTFRIRE